LIVERHPVIEDLGRGDRRFAIIELGEGDFGGVDHGLLVDPAHTLQGPDVKGILSAAITRAFALELAVRFLVGLGLLESGDLGLGQQDAILRHLGFVRRNGSLPRSLVTRATLTRSSGSLLLASISSAIPGGAICAPQQRRPTSAARRAISTSSARS